MEYPVAHSFLKQAASALARAMAGVVHGLECQERVRDLDGERSVIVCRAFFQAQVESSNHPARCPALQRASGLDDIHDPVVRAAGE